ncbi:hypothetical protein U1Q18_024777 [Sarracenia purpurea var. burkii]
MQPCKRVEADTVDQEWIRMCAVGVMKGLASAQLMCYADVAASSSQGPLPGLLLRWSAVLFSAAIARLVAAAVASLVRSVVVIAKFWLNVGFCSVGFGAGATVFAQPWNWCSGIALAHCCCYPDLDKSAVATVLPACCCYNWYCGLILVLIAAVPFAACCFYVHPVGLLSFGLYLRFVSVRAGGVSIYNVVSRSLVDEKSLRDEKTEDYKEVIETLQARIGRLEKESSCGCKKLHNQSEMLLSCDAKLDSQIAQCLDSNGNQKPEEVLRIFMMKEFVGGHIFDDLLIPGVPHRKNQK